MAQCMAMGQAAGTTAALAAGRVGQGLDVRDVPVAAVLDRLRATGAILSLETRRRGRAR